MNLTHAINLLRACTHLYSPIHTAMQATTQNIGVVNNGFSIMEMHS